MGYKPRLNPSQKKFVAQFTEAGSKVFVKKIKKSMVIRGVAGKYGYPMEFPKEFIDKHSFEFTTTSALVCNSRDPESTQVWPLGVTVRMMGGKIRVFAYGKDGWKQFVAENNVQVGDIVVFELVGFAKFRAYLWREDLIRHG